MGRGRGRSRGRGRGSRRSYTSGEREQDCEVKGLG